MARADVRAITLLGTDSRAIDSGRSAAALLERLQYKFTLCAPPPSFMTTINTLADLLSALKQKELAATEEFLGVGHNGMIGDMYEGLTRKMLDAALFKGLDLRVVTGKVRLSNGQLSRQVDAMIVHGDGERLPNTDHFIYPIGRTLVVVEVKKTLYGEYLEDACSNLASLQLPAEDDSAPAGFLRGVLRRLLQAEPPSDGDLSPLGFEREMMAIAAIQDVILPARIVLGYDGFANEKTLRDGFLTRIDAALKSGSAHAYMPARIPSLIVCGDSALVKLNAMPYSVQHDSADTWLLVASTSASPMRIMLEVIWTRLRGHFPVPAHVFGEDLDIEVFSPLLWATPLERDGKIGWQYREEYLSAKELRARPVVESWEPVEVSVPEASLLQILGKQLTIDTKTDTNWAEFSAEVGDGLQSFIDRMRYAGIAAVDSSGTLTLLTDGLATAWIRGERIVVGENATGRLTRWLAKQ